MKFLLVRDMPDHFYAHASKKVMKNFGVFPPLGLLTIASCLRDAGHQVAIIDNEAEMLQLEELDKRFDAFDPDVVGMSLWSSNLHYESNLAQRFKKRKQSLIVLAGGPHLDFYGKETLERFQHIDFGFIGETEFTLVEWVREMERPDGNPHKVPGLVYRSGGEVIANPPPPVENNMDQFPTPAYDLVPINKYFSVLSSQRPTIYMLGSRGCPFKCTFCPNSGGQRIRYYSPEKILKDFLHFHQSLGVKEIHFYDDTFTLHKKRIEKLCALFIENGMAKKVLWTVRARPDTVTPDLLMLMKKAGCYRVGFGVESGNQFILDKMKRDMTLEQVEKAVQWCREAGLEVVTNFILGYIGESKKTLHNTLSYAIRLNSDFAYFSMFRYLPNSPLWNDLPDDSPQKREWENYAKHGIKSFNFDNISAEGLDYSQKYLKRFQTWCYFRFYWRPAKLIQIMRSIKSMEQFIAYAKEGLGLIGI